MEYRDNFSFNDSIYCYPNSDVLRNKLGIHDKDELEKTEAAIIGPKIAQLFLSGTTILKGPKGRFDFNHLKAIHRYLFEDLYDFAGEVRKVDVAKGHIFCNYLNIDSEALRIFDELRSENYYLAYDFAETMEKIVHLFIEIDALHPFREGNGRSQREFAEELAKINGICLDLTRISKEEMVYACGLAVNGDYSMITNLFFDNAEEKPEKQDEYLDKYMDPILCAKAVVQCEKDKRRKRKK